MANSAPSFAVPAPIPVTILTGFLGAGKTSMIRALLQRPDMPRVAVVVNEFGELGIDGEILRNCSDASCPAAEIVELSNGCICCTVADDFLPVMQALLERTPPPERILVETSGLALPRPLIKAFGWPGIRGRAAIDGVIALIDAATLVVDDDDHDSIGIAVSAPETTAETDPNRRHDNAVTELFDEQLAAADLIILNKTDLVTEAELTRYTTALQRRLQGQQERVAIAPILTAVEGKVDPAILLGIKAPHGTDGLPDDDHDHDDFIAHHLRLPAFASLADFEARLNALIARHGILRVKGFAAISDKAARLTVQGVGARLRHFYGEPWRADEKRCTDLVIIGHAGLDRDALTAMMTV